MRQKLVPVPNLTNKAVKLNQASNSQATNNQKKAKRSKSKNQEFAPIEVSIATSEKETKSIPSMYGAGKFDAIIGVEPDRLSIYDRSYLQGYSDNYWESYKKSHALETCSETVELAKSNYSDGYFDGVIGLEPQKELLVTSMAYRSGYQEGIIKYYLNEYQLSN